MRATRLAGALGLLTVVASGAATPFRLATSLAFEENRGQIASPHRFQLRTPQADVLFSGKSIVFQAHGAAVTMRIAAREAVPKGEQLMPGLVHYYLGPGQQFTNIRTYARLRYEGVYPGIDAIFYADGDRLEYDFVVRPGAALEVIRVEFEGVDRLALDERGDLLLHTAAGVLRHRRPALYQQTPAGRRKIAGGYRVVGPAAVAFEAQTYDRTLPLTVDPFTEWSTYFGGTQDDAICGLAADLSGLYVAGYTASPTLPGGGTGVTHKTAFVKKVNPEGNAVLYSTYIGLTVGDTAAARVAVDTAGNAYVIGTAQAAGLPVTSSAYRSVYAGGQDLFVARLGLSGDLQYLTYLGGAGADSPGGIAVDSAGNAVVAGFTNSTDFPTTIAGAFAGSTDLFITKLNASGGAVFSRLMGGTGTDEARAVAVDPAANVYIAGTTDSTFDANGAQTSRAGLKDAFVYKLDPTGVSLLYSTYLGGAADDAAEALAIGSTGAVFVAGGTESTNFPTTVGAYAAIGTGFLVKLIPTPGSAAVYSAYLPLSPPGRIGALAVDGAGNAHVAGSTTLVASPEPVYFKMDTSGAALVSMYIRGAVSAVSGLALDSNGVVYIGGSTAFNTLYSSASALQAQNAGREDGFLIKILPNAPITGSPGAMQSPTPNSRLACGSQLFTWGTGSNVSQFRLQVGTTGLGSSDVFDQLISPSPLSATVSGLPGDGRTVYVRLSSLIGSSWQSLDYVYSACGGAPEKAVLISPAAGSTLAGATQTFQWTKGNMVLEYCFSLSILAPGGTDVLNHCGSGFTADYPDNLPHAGQTIYARLKSRFPSGEWQYVDYTFTAVNLPGVAGVMQSPAPGSTLNSGTITFTWSQGQFVSASRLTIGSTQGGNDIVDWPWTYRNTGVTVGVPVDGRTLYVRVWSRIDTQWEYSDAVYTAVRLPAIVSPAPGATLSGASITFQWTGVPGAQGYLLQIGSTSGSSDLFSSGLLRGSLGDAALRATANVPVDGRNLYARLHIWFPGESNFRWTDFLYKAVLIPPVAAVLTSPAAGVLGGASVTFQWDAGTYVSAYQLSVSVAQGGGELYNVYLGTTRTATVNNFPTDGRTIYARLWSLARNVWLYNDYVFTAASPQKVALVSPLPPGPLGPTVTFQWGQGSGVGGYQLSVGSAIAGGDIFNVYMGLTRSASVSIPCDGRIIYVRLWTLIFGAWQFNDYQYEGCTGGAAELIPPPVSGEVLPSISVVFNWSAGSSAAGYQLSVGSGLAGGDLYNVYLGSARTATVSNLPTDGRTIYVRLWTLIYGSWQFRDYTFRGPTGAVLPDMLTPTSGSLITGVTRFSWTAGTNVAAYQLSVGSVVGEGDRYNVYLGSALEATVSLPNRVGCAVPVYTRLWALVHGQWYSKDYTYQYGTVTCAGSAAQQSNRLQTQREATLSE